MFNSKRMSSEGSHTSRLLSSTRLSVTLIVFNTILILGVTSLFLLFARNTIEAINQEVRKDLKWRTLQLAEEMAMRADYGIAAMDIHAVNQAYRLLNSPGDVVAVVVLNEDNEALWHQGKWPRELDWRSFMNDEKDFHETEHYFIARKFSVIEGVKIGKVAVAVSKARLNVGNLALENFILLIALGCAFALVLSLAFVRFYVGPIVKLTESSLKSFRELSVTLENKVLKRTADLQTANEELEINLIKMQKIQTELVQACRKAGMADVAVCVLHNVGNVLNSINVSANLIKEKLDKSKSSTLHQIVSALEQQDSDRQQRARDEEREKKMFRLLKLVDQSLGEEKMNINEELKSLQSNIDHVKVIVSQQQAHAKAVVGAVENTKISLLVEEVLRMNSSSFKRHHIAVQKEFHDEKFISIDRHKVFQIVVNLLSNARDALMDIDKDKRSITIRTASSDQSVALEVEDTGTGINPQVAMKIFNYGFTTKVGGHGFGLHNSANAAKELGGDLTMHSKGIGQGAIFHLELPIEPPN
ncbi:MAG: GHKL domain-containing protein [Myxococcales bacterium]|nr:MAG: GHKL domain-containing protein [Myxococcales bacterium]